MAAGMPWTARGAMGVQVGDAGTQIIYSYNRLTWTDGVAPPPLVSVSGVIDSPYPGSRVIVNGTTVVNNWIIQPSGSHATGTISIAPNTATTVEVDYYKGPADISDYTAPDWEFLQPEFCVEEITWVGCYRACDHDFE